MAEDSQMAESHGETPGIDSHRKIEAKTTMGPTAHCTRTALIKVVRGLATVGKDEEEVEPWDVVGDGKMVLLSEEAVWTFFGKLNTEPNYL